MNAFWWGSTLEKKKTHWAKWERLCDHKAKGGLGFRHLEDFNQAFLAKKAWNIIRDPSSLVNQVLKMSYFPNSDFLEANDMAGSSQIWKGILWGRELIAKGSRWRIGDGEQVDVLHGVLVIQADRAANSSM